jgi:serine/threonine-protein kinase
MQHSESNVGGFSSSEAGETSQASRPLAHPAESDVTSDNMPLAADISPPSALVGRPITCASAEPSSILKPTAIGSCEILAEIARGGMGVVYRARQRALGRTVAVKVILDAAFSHPEQVRRFETEAQAAANLSHPNIAAIYEFGTHDGRPYLLMEYIDGAPLTAWRESQPNRDERTVAELMRSIALAIEHAHQHGVIHRDLKPSNVLVDRMGAPRIIDFGLAKLITHDASLTASGTALGTPSYMAPEQATGGAARSGAGVDVYGLGAILYELLTGRPPFRAGTVVATLARVVSEPPVPPRLLDAGVSRNLEAICLKCLAKDPADRYPSARALADDLDRVLEGGSAWARRRIGLISKPTRPLLAAGMASVLALFVVLTIKRVEFFPSAALAALGGVTTALVGLALVMFWNELLLPTWLVSRSSHPLAKAAFGLGLILVTLIFNYPALLLIETSEGPKSTAERAIYSVVTAAAVAGLIGKLFCLAGAYHAPAQGALLGSAVADLLGLTLGLGWSGFIRIESTAVPITPWLFLVGALCFVRGLEWIAAGLDAPALQPKARRLRFLLGMVYPALFAISFVGHWVAPWMESGFAMAYVAAWLVSIFLFARLLHGVQHHILQRI